MPASQSTGGLQFSKAQTPHPAGDKGLSPTGRLWPATNASKLHKRTTTPFISVILVDSLCEMKLIPLYKVENFPAATSRQNGGLQFPSVVSNAHLFSGVLLSKYQQPITTKIYHPLHNKTVYTSHAWTKRTLYQYDTKLIKYEGCFE